MHATSLRGSLVSDLHMPAMLGAKREDLKFRERNTFKLINLRSTIIFELFLIDK